jgi:hypothetical protein
MKTNISKLCTWVCKEKEFYLLQRILKLLLIWLYNLIKISRFWDKKNLISLEAKYFVKMNHLLIIMYTFIKTHIVNTLMKYLLHLYTLVMHTTTHRKTHIYNVYMSINLNTKWRKLKRLCFRAKSMFQLVNMICVEKLECQEKRLMKRRIK